VRRTRPATPPRASTSSAPRTLAVGPCHRDHQQGNTGTTLVILEESASGGRQSPGGALTGGLTSPARPEYLVASGHESCHTGGWPGAPGERRAAAGRVRT